MIIYKQIGGKKIAYLFPYIRPSGTPNKNIKIDPELQGIIDRAHELTEEFREELDLCIDIEFRKELDHCINIMSVTERAKNLFHEVLIKLRSALDIAMSKVFKKYSSSNKKPKIYFPIYKNKDDFEKKMKVMGMQNLQTLNKDIYNLILKAQPFETGKNDLSDFMDMANLGKHIGLVIQKIESKEAIKITGPKGTMICTRGVEFPSGNIMGVPIDPKTQRVIPTLEVKDEEITWVEFSLDGYRYNPLIFCPILCQDIRRFLQEMAKFL
jgi:hypothetical protein